MSRSTTVQLSPRGQITLPAASRKQAGVGPGDSVQVTVENGRIVLTPVDVVALERYTDERIVEFDKASKMTSGELDKARGNWAL